MSFIRLSEAQLPQLHLVIPQSTHHENYEKEINTTQQGGAEFTWSPLLLETHSKGREKYPNYVL